MTVLYGIGILIALLAGGAIGLFLTVGHYQRVAAQYRRYEQEVARDRELCAAAHAVLQHYRPTGPGNRQATPP